MNSTLYRKLHIQRLKEAIRGPLSKHFEKLVPAQTWTVYWITHSLSLLEQSHFLTSINDDVIKFIAECSHQDGGYGGGPGQIAHLATTFAAVNALVTVATKEALDSIDRVSLLKFLHRMKQTNGSFMMHDDGEIDSRATYCALALLRILNIEDSILMRNVADWILSCQTYEGGFGSIPGSEAHGGYTFCCVASLCFLNQLNKADMPSLLRWLTNKQMKEDGGFCGRSNKLVDSCYSYWQGAIFGLIHPFLDQFVTDDLANIKELNASFSESKNLNKDISSQTKHNQNRPTTRSTTAAAQTASNSGSGDNQINPETNSIYTDLDDDLETWSFDCGALQDYVLNQCQFRGGLLRDKPSASPDFYHTCYALSGLSLSQHQPNGDILDIGSKPINLLTEIHPLYNVTPSNLNFCFYHFRNKKIETYENDSQVDN